MYILRRWWDRHGIRAGIVCLVIAAAWGVRQNQGLFVVEIYQRLSRPFEPEYTQAEIEENAAVLELQQRLIELENQNQQLQQLLDYVKTRPDQGIAAPVIGRSADHWWQQVTIGRGRRQGIQVGAIVSGTGGLVGRVIQVTPNTSRVLLISDPTSQVGVTISRSRHMGYMRGQAENRAVMEFFDKVPDVRAGDIVSTSSFSQLFPPGLPVGRVESVNLNKSPAPEAVIELSAPISHLEWVMVFPNPKVVDSEVFSGN
ncbi:rod shape-determining protein MreC [Oculatella sp. LEGE 06141]|uniref:rod shape-determining protein MreC n=1 Tax=Oculatella sp. LEGE 06141 TaxID=1828648 RepID=UPI00187EBE03|nr:rod shape-determining protein MreC [Oculatella sp. LEGE 06141]MBE9180771.1 rod shape-determining protein MreC [Oculatella sp. LEGE 06141]